MKYEPLRDVPKADDSVVSETETFVKAAAKQYASDVDALKQALLGPSGRPYRHIPLSTEERDLLYQQLRDQDDPKAWAQWLTAGSINSTLKWWREAEAQHRNDNANPDANPIAVQ